MMQAVNLLLSTVCSDNVEKHEVFNVRMGASFTAFTRSECMYCNMLDRDSDAI